MKTPTNFIPIIGPLYADDLHGAFCTPFVAHLYLGWVKKYLLVSEVFCV